MTSLERKKPDEKRNKFASFQQKEKGDTNNFAAFQEKNEHVHATGRRRTSGKRERAKPSADQDTAQGGCQTTAGCVPTLNLHTTYTQPIHNVHTTYTQPTHNLHSTYTQPTHNLHTTYTLPTQKTYTLNLH